MCLLGDLQLPCPEAKFTHANMYTSMSFRIVYLHQPHGQRRLFALRKLVPDEGQMPEPRQHHDGPAQALVPDKGCGARVDYFHHFVSVLNFAAGEDRPERVDNAHAEIVAEAFARPDLVAGAETLISVAVAGDDVAELVHLDHDDVFHRLFAKPKVAKSLERESESPNHKMLKNTEIYIPTC
jgi:hypothetical protein